MPLSALEGLNLTGQWVKLSTTANSPEKALNSRSQPTKGWFFLVKKINTQSPVSGEGHSSPQLTKPQYFPSLSWTDCLPAPLSLCSSSEVFRKLPAVLIWEFQFCHDTVPTKMWGSPLPDPWNRSSLMFSAPGTSHLSLCSYPQPCLTAPPLPPLFLLKPQLFFKAPTQIPPGLAVTFLTALSSVRAFSSWHDVIMYDVLCYVAIFLWSQFSLFNFLATSPSICLLNSATTGLNKFISIGWMRIWVFK